MKLECLHGSILSSANFNRVTTYVRAAAKDSEESIDKCYPWKVLCDKRVVEGELYSGRGWSLANSVVVERLEPLV